MKQNQTYKSTCCYCGVGCGITVKKYAENKISIDGDPLNPVNKGMLCSKGLNLHYTVMDQSDRLLYPQMRMSRNGTLIRSSWDETLGMCVDKFKSLINEYGPDSVGFYVSGQCLTEEYYVINKLMKGFIGSNNIDTNSRLCMSSAVSGYKLSLGEDSVPCSYEDIELADCFYIAGANPAWCHPILYRRIEAHKAANPNIKIIVADPRKTQSCDLADIHLQLKPGTDIVLNYAIGRCLIERGYIDTNFIKNHTEGFEGYKEKVMSRSLEEAANICEVSAEEIVEAAKHIVEAKGFISLWAMGLNQSVIGVNKNLSLINLSLITGKIGKPGNGPFSLTGQPNAMGGREVGGLCNLLPNHRNLENPEDRKFVQDFWRGKEIQSKPGLSATEMFDALEAGKLKAIWIVCTNPLVSLPDARKVERALEKAEFVVVQDISNRSATVKYADVILPAATWAEKEGTMTNSERRISYLSPVVSPPGEALPDAEIIIRFAKKMGFGSAFEHNNMSEVFDEHCRLSKGTNMDISALNYEILKSKGSVQWPFTSPDGEGMKRLFTDHLFYTSNKKAIINAVPDANESENTDNNFPLILTTGRIRDQWHTMTRTGKVNKLNQHSAEPFVEIHPIDAALRGLRDGDLVEVQSRRGNARMNAKITGDIKQGVVFLPMHWGKILNSDLSRANNLTNNLVDAKSKEPDFKFSAVQVTKHAKPKQRIIIIGAGAGAYGFIQSYRKLNLTDEIVVFSKEINPFYNRVLLPDYVSGSKSWEQLQKMADEERSALDFTVHKGISIERIDKRNKKVYDSNGNEHSYDLLIMSMGSRAIVPADIPMNKEGIITIRSREDAEKLKYRVAEGKNVVILGGGLLGLEMAGALCENDVKVTVIQKTTRLMERQLDILGSEMLHHELVNAGITIHFNEQIENISGREIITGVQLKSGEKIICDALIIAVGTTPNVELAKEAGLNCNRGTVVNEYLQTSDENIFAIGEIAEFDNMLFGITVAAEEQADILAKHISGNMNVYYQGSLLMNILKIQGVDLCSLGMVQAPENNPEYEEVIFFDRAKRYYKKCIVHNDKLIGAVLIGDKSEFIEFKNLIKNKLELGEKRSKLLRSDSKSEPLEGAVVCSCNNVGSGNILKKIKDGHTELNALTNVSGAGMGCGSCKPEVRKILEQELKFQKENRKLIAA